MEKTSEEKLAALEKRIKALEDWRHTREPEEEDEYKPFSIPLDPPKTPGRPTHIPAWRFTRRRDAMIVFFENFWPELEVIFGLPNPEPTILQQRLRNFLPGRKGEEHYERLLANPEALWSAVYGKEITRAPRSLACALAGVPEMKLRSSLARCEREPSSRPIELRAMRTHIASEHKPWFKRLEKDGVCEATLAKMPECPNCQLYVSDPDRLKQVIELKLFPIPPDVFF